MLGTPFGRDTKMTVWIRTQTGLAGGYRAPVDRTSPPGGLIRCSLGGRQRSEGLWEKSDKPEKLRAGSRSIRADKVKVQKCEKTFRSHTAAGKFLFETVSVWRKPQYDETEDRNAVACGLQSTICSSSYGDSYAGAFCACVLQSYVVYVFFRKAYYVESYEL